MQRFIGRAYKQGNSIAISIPRGLREQIGVKQGDLVEMTATWRATLAARKVTEAYAIEKAREHGVRTSLGRKAQ